MVRAARSSGQWRGVSLSRSLAFRVAGVARHAGRARITHFASDCCLPCGPGSGRVLSRLVSYSARSCFFTKSRENNGIGFPQLLNCTYSSSARQWKTKKSSIVLSHSQQSQTADAEIQTLSDSSTSMSAIRPSQPRRDRTRITRPSRCAGASQVAAAIGLLAPRSPPPPPPLPPPPPPRSHFVVRSLRTSRSPPPHRPPRPIHSKVGAGAC